MVAYLILSYTPHVDRLVARLRAGSPDAVVAVHHDDRRCALGPVDALRIDPRPIEWGHGSQLAAVLRCVRWLHERADFDWLVLLSGQDYPVRPIAEIEASLNGADAYIEAFPVPRPALRRGMVDEFAKRYHYRWRPLREGLVALAARVDPLVQVRRLPSGVFAGLPARRDYAVHRGSDWFTLSRAAVESVLRAEPAVVDHFLHTIVPTEALVHTVLVNDPALRLIYDNRRFAAFDPGASNPRILGVEDLDTALASGAHFARKFDDLAVLDAIDDRVQA